MCSQIVSSQLAAVYASSVHLSPERKLKPTTWRRPDQAAALHAFRDREPRTRPGRGASLTRLRAAARSCPAPQPSEARRPQARDRPNPHRHTGRKRGEVRKKKLFFLLIMFCYNINVKYRKTCYKNKNCPEYHHEDRTLILIYFQSFLYASIST